MNRISTYTDFKRFINSDARSRGVEVSFVRFLKDPISRFMLALRIYEYALNSGMFKPFRLLITIYFRSISLKLGFSIPPNVFDEGLAIVHYGNIIISPYTQIGKNCRIHVGVNIGGAGKFTSIEEAKNLDPKIGDNCYIGPGVKIYGPIRIGNDCAMGANAVVGKSFEQDNITLGGIPAKIISERGSNGMIIKGCAI
jgi:serine O-acetyltransferase